MSSRELSSGLFRSLFAPTSVVSRFSSSTSKSPDEDGFDDMDSISASPADFQGMKSKDRTRGLHLLEFFVARCHEIGTGDPKEVICHEVIRVWPDLLVVGCRGLGPFQRVFVGTVSEICVKHVECPVITIKRRAEETPQDPVDD